MLKIKALSIAILLATTPIADMTLTDIANIEHVTMNQYGVSIEYNGDYCYNNDLDYRGYWIDFTDLSIENNE